MTQAEKMAEEYSDLWDIDTIGLEWVPKKKIAELIQRVAERTRKECAEVIDDVVRDIVEVPTAKQAVLNARWEDEEG